MKRCTAVLFTLIAGTVLVFAGGKKEAEVLTVNDEVPATLNVAALIGPSGVGMAYLFSNHPDLGTATAVSLEAEASVDILLPKLINGDIDIGILPPNVAAKLYNLDGKSIVAGAVVGNGMLSLVTRDSSIRTMADLAGKKVSVAGQGSTPEYVFRALLEKAGLKKDSVTLDYSIPTPELAAALVSGRISYAVLPEPFATLAVMNGADGSVPIIRAIRLRDAWKESDLGSDFPMTVCVIRKAYAERHPSTVRKFLAAYKASIEWTVAHPAESGAMVEAANLGLKAPVVTKAIPSSNYVYIPADEGRDSIESLLSVFLGFSPESIGGRLPDDGFYFR